MDKKMTIEYDYDMDYLKVIKDYLENNIVSLDSLNQNNLIEITILSDTNIAELLNQDLTQFIMDFNNEINNKINVESSDIESSNIRTLNIGTSIIEIPIFKNSYLNYLNNYDVKNKYYKIKSYNIYYNYVRTLDKLYETTFNKNKLFSYVIDYLVPESIKYSIIKYIYRIEFVYGVDTNETKLSNYFWENTNYDIENKITPSNKNTQDIFESIV